MLTVILKVCAEFENNQIALKSNEVKHKRFGGVSLSRDVDIIFY